MIGSLTGTVTATLGQRTLIDVRGVGYWVHTGSWTPEGEVTCYVHPHIREDAFDLYGFPDIATLELFEKLISVSGIGPKAALALLSIGSADRLKQAIISNDLGFLSSAPGIGQKAAQKLVVELQGKIDALPLNGERLTTDHEDVSVALEGLGYRPKEIRQALREMPDSLESVDAKLKWALQKLSS